MPGIELKNVDNFIFDNLHLKVHDQELLVLLGQNGAGKTTLLNIIAGLAEYSGSVFFDGECMDNVPACNRNVGYLFQNLLLFPHLNVYENICYGLKARGWAGSELKNRAREMLQLVKIEKLSLRYPKHLSGGEKQRAALARAIAPQPRVLLLDEPLSGLDQETSAYLKQEFKHIQKDLGITAVYVTHNPSEALEVADRMCVIEDGSIRNVSHLKERPVFLNNMLIS